MEASETKISSKKKVVIDCRVVADLSKAARFAWARDGESPIEAAARAIEGRARDFNEFIRDHRSQDDIRLEVERIYEDQCSHCGGVWETMLDNGNECCANCGLPTAAKGTPNAE